MSIGFVLIILITFLSYIFVVVYMQFHSCPEDESKFCLYTSSPLSIVDFLVNSTPLNWAIYTMSSLNFIPRIWLSCLLKNDKLVSFCTTKFCLYSRNFNECLYLHFNLPVWSGERVTTAANGLREQTHRNQNFSRCSMLATLTDEWTRLSTQRIVKIPIKFTPTSWCAPPLVFTAPA